MTRERSPEPRLGKRLLELHEILGCRPSLLTRLRLRDDARLAALDELARIAKPLQAVGLLCFLRERGELRARAARAIAALMARVTPFQLGQIDAALRGGMARAYFGGVVQPGSVAALARRFPNEPALVGLYASHPNGFVREAALKQLGEVRDGRELRYLALRANDWVDPVASLADSLLRERLTAANRSAVCAELPFFVGLGERSRRDHRPLVQAIGEVLRSDGGRDFVAAAADFAGTSRSLCFEWLLAGSLPIDAPGLVAGLAHPVPGVQLASVRALARCPDANGVTRALHEAARGRWPLVRAEALQLLTGRGAGADTSALIREALFDRSALVRRRARWLARELGLELDPGALLRDALAGGGGREVTAALEVLGERGSREDARQVAALVTHSASRVRATALVALGRLAPPDALSHALAHLSDSARSVRRVALAIARLHAQDLDYGAIYAQVRAAADSGARRDSLALLARASKWQALEILLQALGDPDESVRGQALAHLDQWCARFNRSFAQPTAEQVERIARSRAAAGERVTPQLAELLRVTLRPT